MHAVVNHLRFGVPFDPALSADAKDGLAARMQAIGGFEAFHVIETSDRDAILVIVAADAQALDRVATDVGSLWMRAQVVPLLAAPPDRQLGPIIASTQYP